MKFRFSKPWMTPYILYMFHKCFCEEAGALEDGA